MPTAKKIFDKNAKQRVVEAIRKAEARTSGQIKVYVEDRCKGPAFDRAKALFGELELDKTERQNGALIYLALKDHKFAILGDKGIHEQEPPGFWDETRDEMRDFFKRGAFLEGVERGVQKVGDELAAFFPYESGQDNELPDEIIVK